jgi:EamA domain-containing membrane protein RarD
MRYALLICFGLLPYLLLSMHPRMSELYGIWLDVGWIFIVAGAVSWAFAQAEQKAKAKAETERLLALREKALREQIREEVVGERLLHSLN